MVGEKKKNRLLTDALREIWQTRNRFLSLFVLAMLAVSFLSGLRTAAPDMEYTADRYYDRQNLMDIQVLSTLGLTEEDVEALEAREGVTAVEGERSLDMVAGEEIVRVASLPEKINLVAVVEGRLPEAPDECVTEQRLLTELGLGVGDTLTLEAPEDQEDTLARDTFTIVGVVNSPLYVGPDRGSSSIGSGSIKAFLYVPKENFDHWDYYTAIYCTVSGMAELETYSDAYEDSMDDYLDAMESFGEERAQLRYDTVVSEAQQELADAQAEYDEAKAEAEQELEDARQELEDARRELDEGWAEYHDGLDTLERETADAQQELSDGARELADALVELNDGEKEYADGLADYQGGLAEWQDGKQEYEDGLQEYQDGLAEWQDGWAEYEDGVAQWQEGRQELDDGWAEYYDGLEQYEDGVRSMDAAAAQLSSAAAQLNSARAQLDSGWQQVNDNWPTLKAQLLTMLRGQEGAEQFAAAIEAIDSIDKDNAPTLIGILNQMGFSDTIAGQVGGLQTYRDGIQAVLDAVSAGGQEPGGETGDQEPEPGGETGGAETGTDALADDGTQTGEDGEGEGGQPSDPDVPPDPWETINAQWGGVKTQLAAMAQDQQQAAYIMGITAIDASNAQTVISILDTTIGALNQTRAFPGSLQDLVDGETEYQSGLAQYQSGAAQYNAGMQQLREAKEELDAALVALEDGEAELSDGWTELEEGRLELEDGRAELEDARIQLEDAEKEINDGWAELEDARIQLEDARRELDDGWTEYYDGLDELEDGRATLARETADAQKELDDAYLELTDGEQEYADGLQEYEDGKAEADEELSDGQRELDDARQDIADIEPCEWYLLGRDANVGLVQFSQDAERVGNLAAVFPVIFFLVAALACLTTMTRMVEEQRTQIGSLKALGFSKLAISVKYLGYAFLASLTGGLVGLAIGCTLIPLVIANAFNIMYVMPPLEFKFQPGISAIAVGAAVVCTTGASLWACLATLIDTPANLMRPKAPPVGRRVFLEYITVLWKRMTFTWKVTMRNLFRYQRRFWMTVIGIGGCTALVVTGFGLHNSIFDILDKQFDEISVYDATVGLDEDMTAEELQAVRDTLDGESGVDGYLTSCQLNVDTIGADRLVTGVYLFAVEDQEAFQQFIDLRHLKDGSAVVLPEAGLVITQKLSELLDLEIGDSITLEKDDRRYTAPVTDIAENYVYHYIYLTDEYYAQLFGEEAVDNVLMLRYADESEETADRVSRELMSLEGVLSYSNISTMRETFTDSMTSIDYAVVIIILSAAALAFVVLYNLTNINITERMRELATLKVLGFYDRETSAYVYRENIFLTLFGIILGLVLGRFLHSWMVVTVEVDLVMFGRTAPPYAYIMAAGLTVVFSAIVNVVAHFSLKKIDMVESLKTVE